MPGGMCLGGGDPRVSKLSRKGKRRREKRKGISSSGGAKPLKNGGGSAVGAGIDPPRYSLFLFRRPSAVVQWQRSYVLYLDLLSDPVSLSLSLLCSDVSQGQHGRRRHFSLFFLSFPRSSLSLAAPDAAGMDSQEKNLSIRTRPF